MADVSPEGSDIETIFKRLRSIPANKSCFDCNAKNPTWASVTYGVFICIDCSAVHRGLGVHLSFVRSTQLDTNWTWHQIRHMQLGGNANALTFFRQHNCDTTDAQVKYNSRAAQLYRDKLDHAVKQAIKLHGTKLHLDGGSVAESHTEEKKGTDFFDTIINSNDDTSGFETNFPTRPLAKPTPTCLPASTKDNNYSNSTTNLEIQVSPKVEGAFSNNSSVSLTNHLPTIGRKIPAKRVGLGAKKPGGLGAQKVKANFADIEREAELADQLKESIETNKKSQMQAPEQSMEEQDAKMASMRLAYQDLSLQQKKEEEKLKQVDPKKAQQMERLGMGFSGRGEIHHSALSDMQIIKQDTPYVKPKPVSPLMDYSLDDSFSSFLSKVEKTKDSDFVFLSTSKADHSSWTGSDSKSSSMWDKPSNDIDSLWNDNFTSNASPPKSTSSSNWEKTVDSSSSFSKPSKITSTPKVVAPSSSDVQKKFGAAKSISSAQYFGDSTEEKCNLSRFEGSTSISSADLFGGGNAAQDYSAGYTPDLDDVKESVRQGVTKVAGKLSSLANGVMSSIQEKYGGY